MTNTATTTYQALLSGQLLTTTAGRARISLQQVRPGVFNITTQQGTQRVAEWSCSYDNAATALAERDRAAKAFDAFSTDVALAAAYDTARDQLEYWTHRRGDQARELRIRLRGEVDALQPLRGRARDEELKARRDADLADDIRETIRVAAIVNALPPAERPDAWQAARDSFEASRLPVQPVGLPRRNTIQPSN